MSWLKHSVKHIMGKLARLPSSAPRAVGADDHAHAVACAATQVVGAAADVLRAEDAIVVVAEVKPAMLADLVEGAADDVTNDAAFVTGVN